jgi:hypothetical protein
MIDTPIEAARELVEINLTVGTQLQGGKSSVTEHVSRGGVITGVVVTRAATGSTESVSTRMMAKTIERIRADEQLGKRSISGTTTVEATVAAALGLSFDGTKYVLTADQ